MMDTEKPVPSAPLSALHRGAVEAAQGVSDRLILEVDKVARRVFDAGLRHARPPGDGMDVHDRVVHNPERSLRQDHRATARNPSGERIDQVREPEVSHTIQLWRKGGPGMNYRSPTAPFSKGDSAAIMMLAMAQHMMRHEEKVGFLDGGSVTYTGKNSLPRLMPAFQALPDHSLPMPYRSVPRNSSVALIIDAATNPGDLAEALAPLRHRRANGAVIVLLDPDEIDFNFKGHVGFIDSGNTLRKEFEKAEAHREAYRRNLSARLGALRDAVQTHGFRLILQPTDEPLENGILAFYKRHAGTIDHRLTLPEGPR